VKFRNLKEKKIFCSERKINLNFFFIIFFFFQKNSKNFFPLKIFTPHLQPFNTILKELLMLSLAIMRHFSSWQKNNLSPIPQELFLALKGLRKRMIVNWE